MERRAILAYAVPLLAALGIALVVGTLLLTELGGTPPRPRAPGGLLLLCDEDLRDPVEAPDIEHESGAVGRFQRRAGLRIEAHYAPSAELLDQLLSRQGDVLLTADERLLDSAREADLVQDVHPVATLVPAIAVRRGSPREVTRLPDLAHPALRLALVSEGAGPMGRVSAEVLRRGGAPFDELDNVSVLADSALEAVRAVDLGRADAAIVWRSTAKAHSRNATVVEIPPQQNVTVPVRAAVLTTAQDPAAARRFADFLAGPAAGEVFEMYGFGTAE